MANTVGGKLLINTNFFKSAHNNNPFICATKDRENGSNIFIVASLQVTEPNKKSRKLFSFRLENQHYLQ